MCFEMVHKLTIVAIRQFINKILKFNFPKGFAEAIRLPQLAI